LHGLDPHDRLANPGAVDGKGAGAIRDYAGGACIFVERPGEAFPGGAGEDAGFEGFLEAGGGDFTEGFEVSSKLESIGVRFEE
jgi:hypothetical protein